MPHESSPPAAVWIGEGAPIPVQSATISSATADLCKLGLISVLTRELLDRSSPAAEAVIRRVLTAAAAKFTDSEFLDPTKAAVSGVMPGSVTNGGVQHVDRLNRSGNPCRHRGNDCGIAAMGRPRPHHEAFHAGIDRSEDSQAL